MSGRSGWTLGSGEAVAGALVGRVAGASAPQGGAFVADLEGPMAQLDRVVGRTYGRDCDAVLGDARCGLSEGEIAGADL